MNPQQESEAERPRNGADGDGLSGALLGASSSLLCMVVLTLIMAPVSKATGEIGVTSLSTSGQQ